MKRWIWIALAALAVSPAISSAATVGVGVFGGTSIPIVQEDNDRGPMYGLRVPINLTPIVSIEPYYGSTQGGDKNETVAGVTYTRAGIDNTAFGVHVLFMFGTGVQFYPFVGLASNHLKRDGLDESQTGYDFGLGFGFKLPVVGLSAHARGGANIVTSPASSETSRKWGEITLGVSYNFYHSVIP
ncbi:MAG: outer membrane beta-barrel protein [Candidatus Eisenbacteria bacterium]|nr:outer membrane beta-barrel protein [Candidatus Eisenbacteria bacterium]